MQAHLAAAFEPDHAARGLLVGVASRQGLVGEIGDQRVEIRTAQGAQHVGAVQHIGPVDAAEMDEDLAIRVAEHEPGIPLVGHATVGFHGYIGPAQQLAHTEEIGKLLVAPVLLRIGEEPGQSGAGDIAEADASILGLSEGQGLVLVRQEILSRGSVAFVPEGEDLRHMRIVPIKLNRVVLYR